MKTMAKFGRIRDTRIIIHWSFLLILLWLVVINIIAVAGITEIIWCGLLVFAYLFSLVLHEYSHALAGILCGYRRNEVLMLPTGAVGRPMNNSLKRFEKILISLAGPLANICVAIILKYFVQPYAAYWNEPENIGVVSAGNFLFQVQLVNLGLGLVNLIPALPMDGGHILLDIMATRISYQKARKAMAVLTRIIAYGALLFGIMTISLLWVLFGIYVALTWTAEDEYGRWKQRTNALDLAADHNKILMRT